MDGELVAFNGKFFRIAPDGKTHLIPPEQTTPYAVVTFFKPEQEVEVSNVSCYEDLVEILNKHVTNRNIPWAINISGIYETVQLRAVRGAKPPYPTFEELASKQAYFDLENIEGEGVGFFFPPFLAKANTPGYHIHFITSDFKTGGHILKCSIKKATIKLMPLYSWTLDFPRTEDYAKTDKLNVDYSGTLKESFGAGIQFK